MKNNLGWFTLMGVAVVVQAEGEPRCAYDTIKLQYVGAQDANGMLFGVQSMLGGTNVFGDVEIETRQGTGANPLSQERSMYLDVGYRMQLSRVDLNWTLGYVQQQGTSVTDINQMGSALVLGFAWRQKFAPDWEYRIGYQHWAGTTTVILGPNYITKSSNDRDTVSGELRYEIKAGWEASLGYRWERNAESSANSTWYVGVGYNF